MISVLGAIAQAITGRTELLRHVCLFYKTEGYRVGAVELDLILDEHHEQSAQVTENPLQDGRAVSDGIYVELRDGTLTGLVSNHSIKHATPLDVQSLEALLERAKDFKLKNRAKQAWEDLKKVQRDKQLVTIVTALEVYENVAITKIETDRSGDSGDALEIKVQFRQVQKVELSEHQITLEVKRPENMNTDLNRASAVQVDSGQQVGGEPTAADKEQLFLGVQ